MRLSNVCKRGYTLVTAESEIVEVYFWGRWLSGGDTGRANDRRLLLKIYVFGVRAAGLSGAIGPATNRVGGGTITEVTSR